MIPTPTPAALAPPATPYVAYAYAYPHKTAYRPLDPAVPLAGLWAGEDRAALSLYIHLPFCEMRCGFCNLFTTANPQDGFVAAYLDALERQARTVRAALGPARVARFALGGGTPTYLTVAELARVLDLAADLYGADPARVPTSVETSPGTATADRLALLRERGVSRVSIGVQSFAEAEARAAGRAQRTAEVHAALAAIRRAAIPTLNIDLIYGLPGQTVATWLESLEAALAYAPEELYLYPLYTRPLTGLGRRGLPPAADVRLACYRAGRARLLAAGYTQVSMRMFRAARAPADDGPAYCCQDDGMVGLGCGARSYTHGLHYATEYAVGAAGVRAILAAYVARPDAAFAVADYGIRLDGDEQRRRYALQSLLQAAGLDRAAYRARFGSDVLADLLPVADWTNWGWVEIEPERVQLTPAGLEYSDWIGPALASPTVAARMESYAWR
jgi:oxygen-independent coproporphyrinogen-3 oxidase